MGKWYEWTQRNRAQAEQCRKVIYDRLGATVRDAIEACHASGESLPTLLRLAEGKGANQLTLVAITNYWSLLSVSEVKKPRK